MAACSPRSSAVRALVVAEAAGVAGVDVEGADGVAGAGRSGVDRTAGDADLLRLGSNVRPPVPCPLRGRRRPSRMRPGGGPQGLQAGPLVALVLGLVDGQGLVRGRVRRAEAAVVGDGDADRVGRADRVRAEHHLLEQLVERLVVGTAPPRPSTRSAAGRGRSLHPQVASPGCREWVRGPGDVDPCAGLRGRFLDRWLSLPSYPRRRVSGSADVVEAGSPYGAARPRWLRSPGRYGLR